MFLKRKIKHWTISSYSLNHLLKLWVNFKNNDLGKLTNKKTDLFEWEKYKRKISPYFFHPIIDNNFYGIGSSLNTYAGLKKYNLIKCYIEHGYFFGSYISEDSKKYWCKNIITFGEKRRKHLECHSFNNIYQIGPYIHYAEDYSSISKYKKYKSELGKMLLVFPMHASTGTYLDYDFKLFFDFIDNMKNEYDNVVVCVFWADLNNEKLIHECKSRQYKIFSAGNRYDQFFLSRLKDIITLSSMTVSNGVGTHLIYSVYLEKPHYIFKQKIYEKSLNEKGDFELSIYNDEEYNVRKDEMAKLETLFGNTFSNKLTSEQIKYCRTNFGFGQIKTPQEILKILHGEF